MIEGRCCQVINNVCVVYTVTFCLGVRSCETTAGVPEEIVDSVFRHSVRRVS